MTKKTSPIKLVIISGSTTSKPPEGDNPTIPQKPPGSPESSGHPPVPANASPTRAGEYPPAPRRLRDDHFAYQRPR